MRKLGILGIVLFFGLTALSPIANGQTAIPLLGTEYGVGVRAIGMGGAFVSIANDYSASYWNPAGLGQLRRMELTGSFNSLRYKSETEYFSNPFSEDKNYTGINSFGYVFPVPTFRGSLVFALGYNKVVNYNNIFAIQGFNDAPSDSVNQNASQYDRGGLNQWTFAGSMQMSEHLYLGGSINFWTGKYDYTWELNETDNLDLYEESAWKYQDQIDTRITGLSFKFATLYNLYDRFRFGATIETPITFTNQEDWSTLDVVDYDDNTYWDTTSAGEFEYKIRKPLTLNVGASLSLPLLTVSGDVTFTDWSQMEYTDTPGLDQENHEFLKNLEATTQYRIGAELALPLVNTRFRAGYIIETDPYKDNSLYSDKNFITAGAGILLDRQFTIDLAVVHGWWDYTGADNYTEEIKIFNYFISASFRF